MEDFIDNFVLTSLKKVIGAHLDIMRNIAHGNDDLVIAGKAAIASMGAVGSALVDAFSTSATDDDISTIILEFVNDELMSKTFRDKSKELYHFAVSNKMLQPATYNSTNLSLTRQSLAKLHDSLKALSSEDSEDKAAMTSVVVDDVADLDNGTSEILIEPTLESDNIPGLFLVIGGAVSGKSRLLQSLHNTHQAFTDLIFACEPDHRSIGEYDYALKYIQLWLYSNQSKQKGTLIVDSLKDALYIEGNLTKGGVSLTSLANLTKLSRLCMQNSMTVIASLNPLQSIESIDLFNLLAGSVTGVIVLRDNAVISGTFRVYDPEQGFYYRGRIKTDEDLANIINGKQSVLNELRRTYHQANNDIVVSNSNQDEVTFQLDLHIDRDHIKRDSLVQSLLNTLE